CILPVPQPCPASHGMMVLEAGSTGSESQGVFHGSCAWKSPPPVLPVLPLLDDVVLALVDAAVLALLEDVVLALLVVAAPLPPAPVVAAALPPAPVVAAALP